MSQRAPQVKVLLAPGATPLVVRMAGVTARVSGMPQRLRAELSALLRPFVLGGAATEAAEVEIELRSAPGAADWQALVGGEQVLRSGSSTRMLRDLEWLVVARSLACSRERIVWHAASLAWGSRAVILVAESGAGKSTLTVSLALRGWRPLADDLTLLDPATYTLDPFRRCFHVSPAVSELAASADLLTWPAPELADYARPRRWGRDGRAPAWIVVVRRDSSAPASLTPLSRAEAAGALFAATIRNHAAASAASAAARVAGSALGCWALNNGDLNATVDLLMSTLLGAEGGAPLVAR